MADEQKPIPGTWGAVVRSERPMPWRQMLRDVCFTPEELGRRLADGTFIQEQSRRVREALKLL
jgi:hypothetical protein